MDFAELKKSLGELKLSDAEKAEAGKLLGIEAPAAAASDNGPDLELSDKITKMEVELSAQKTANKSLTESVTKLTTEIRTRNENEVIALALEEGRIKPADEKKWREDYGKAPEIVGPIIANLPPVVDFSTQGTGAGGGEGEIKLDADDKAAARRLNMTDDEYLVSIGKKKAPAPKEPAK